MLHIHTITMRFENLPIMWGDLKKYSDITWHICGSSRREDWIEYEFFNDERVKVYKIDVEESLNSVQAKRNRIFQEIKNSWFCLLDDDNILHENMYRVYMKYRTETFKGLIVGKLQRTGDILRETYPGKGNVDTANALCHSSVLEKVKYGKRDLCSDSLFWKACFDALGGEENTILIPEVIAWYNKIDSCWDDFEERSKNKIFEEC